MAISEGVGAEVLLWLVGFQQDIKNLVRGYIVFVVQMIVFGEFCLNVVPLYSFEICLFVLHNRKHPDTLDGPWRPLDNTIHVSTYHPPIQIM